MKRNPRPRKYESAAARQAAYKARAEMLEFRAEPKTAATLTSIAEELDVSRSELLLSMVKFALTNHDWARFGLTHKTLPYYQGNPIMATKKASPAQLAARKKFAEMARSGAFKKAKRAADRDKNPVKVTRHKAAKKTVSQKISQLVHEGYPQKQAVAVALSEKRAGKVKSNPMGEKFAVGKYYETRFIGDQNIKVGATILSRTDKTVKVKGTDNMMKSSYRLSMDHNQNECFYPYGKYSMSPMLCADDMKTKSNPIKSSKKTTRTNPSKRTRSAVVLNPRARKPQKVYTVSIMQDGLHTKFMGLANFFTFAEAENYAHYLHKQHKNWTIRVHDTRAMK